MRAPFLFRSIRIFAFGVGSLFVWAGSAAHASAGDTLSIRIEKARELVLKGDRTGAVKIFKELHREVAANLSSKAAKEVDQSWREIAEVYLTDKSQNQASLAESFWLTRPKEAVDLLIPVLKLEDGNLSVAKIGARAALRALDCTRAETLVAQAEVTFPIGSEVKLLRMQALDCTNGSTPSAQAIETSGTWGELEPAIRALVVKDALRRKDLKSARTALSAWESAAGANEDPQMWYWKWRISAEASRDRSSGRKFLRICTEMTARRRKNFAMHPDLCLQTESIESELKSSDKSG